tara:strand:- start:5538 stop:9368 length:3831 start_codon:yes stop_codon:yes gene_type:complete
MNKYIVLFILIYLGCGIGNTQESHTISWSGVKTVSHNDSVFNVLDFDNSIYDSTISLNKIYFDKIPINNNNVELSISNIIYTDLLDSELDKVMTQELTENVAYNYYISTEKKQHYLIFYLIPFSKRGNSIKKVSSFDIQIHQNKITRLSQKIEPVNSSILSTGNWYKIGVTETGLHKLDAYFLSSMGVNVANINPNEIKIYGNKAGMLSEGMIEIDDLLELSIDVVGADDNSFDNDDYIIFFGQGPHVWDYDDNQFVYKKNIYTDTTYYFISFDSGLGKRIDNLPHNYTLGDPTEADPVTSYDTYFIHEQDDINLVNTGRQWFGESFAFDANQNFETPIQNWLNDTVILKANLAARSSVTSMFEFSSGSTNIGNVSISSVSSSSNTYYNSSILVQSFLPNLDYSTISINYNSNGNGSALAWLDYFSLQGRASLNVNATSHFLFRDIESVSDAISTNFKLSKSSNNHACIVWNVTDPINTKRQLLAIDGLNCFFKTNTPSLQEFLVIANYNNAFIPHPVGLIPNQNIHGSSLPSYIIVTHPDFFNAANRLSSYHINNGDNVLLVTTDQVYNEFSTGSQDIGAIRSLLKMFYDRAGTIDEIPKNVLLFGDASFDYKNKLYGTSNFVPTYQSFVSSSIESSYCTDDYFGVLDDSEGFWNGGLSSSINNDMIDIGIGRIPVTNLEDADKFVDKILNYHSLASRGKWKNEICFVADDADAAWESNLILHADALAEKLDTLHPKFNVQKIYLDSYQQSLSLGSQRYPDAQEDLIKLINDGALIVNYVGHGGEVGWASERILELSDINNFENINKLPVFITATCEFTRYDDPTRISAGEYLILNPNGGAIGLYSTSRTVAESPTYSLVNALYNYFPNHDSDYTFGEALTLCKNDPSAGFNVVKRKFSFFGDPNLKLAQPTFNINTTSIELIDSLGQIIPFVSDTINSLSHVKISGEIVNDSNYLLTDFTGVLYMTVFDKPSLFSTLNNDGFLTEPFNYFLQNNKIYNGKVDVADGLWSFEFIVPKDISYQYGNGKISYYATDSIIGDASGVDEDIIIGGFSDYAIMDVDGPTIQLFMNDTNFVSGGYTNSSPELLALLFDVSGINTIGTGIGHNLTAVLDDDSWNQYILNDYYESDLNSFQSGQVRYPFFDLMDGDHTLTFKAWDVHNNSNSVDLSFFVTSSSELAIEHLFNYPNPASSFTNFVFEHNRPGEILDVRLDIFGLNGELVKTLSTNILSTGFRDQSITWNIDSSISRGIYIYRLSVQSGDDNSISQKTEKLIIVR